MIDVSVRDWLKKRNAITNVCSRIDLAGDSSGKATYPRITVAQVSDFRNRDLDGERNDRRQRVQIDVWSEKGQVGSSIEGLIEAELEYMPGTRLGGREVLDVDVDNVYRRTPSPGPAVATAEAVDRVTIDLLFLFQ